MDVQSSVHSDWKRVRVVIDVVVKTPLLAKAVEDAVADLVYKRDLKSIVKDALAETLDDEFELESIGVSTPQA